MKLGQHVLPFWPKNVPSFFKMIILPVNEIYLTLHIVFTPPTYMCHMMFLAEHKCRRPPFSILISAHTSTAVPMLPMSIVGK